MIITSSSDFVYHCRDLFDFFLSSISPFCDNVIAILCTKVCDADFELAQTVHMMKIKATVVFIYLFISL